jgi:hypothetical protein
MQRQYSPRPVQKHPKLHERKEYEVDAHWALYCENYLEGFHIPYVHKSLNAIVDYGTYTTETFRYSSVQTGFEEDGKIAARYLFVFPNLMFNFYPWGISVNIVRPVSPSKSVVEFLSYVRDESKLNEGAGADLLSVEMEDEAVVESVQKGIRSPVLLSRPLFADARTGNASFSQADRGIYGIERMAKDSKTRNGNRNTPFRDRAAQRPVLSKGRAGDLRF